MQTFRDFIGSELCRGAGAYVVENGLSAIAFQLHERRDTLTEFRVG